MFVVTRMDDPSRFWNFKGQRAALSSRHVSCVKTNTQGFTLTEIAIVLGIIGLILGAIWVAAANVYNNLRITKATTELLEIAQNVRSLYAMDLSVDQGADMTGDPQPAGSFRTYLKAGIFPSDTLDTGNPATATQAFDPWDGNIDVDAVTINTPGDGFSIAISGMPQSACFNLIMATIGSNNIPGLAQVQVGFLPITQTIINFPTALSIATIAQQLCGSAPQSYGYISMAFIFHLK